MTCQRDQTGDTHIMFQQAEGLQGSWAQCKLKQWPGVPQTVPQSSNGHVASLWSPCLPLPSQPVHADAAC